MGDFNAGMSKVDRQLWGALALIPGQFGEFWAHPATRSPSLGWAAGQLGQKDVPGLIFVDPILLPPHHPAPTPAGRF